MYLGEIETKFKNILTSYSVAKSESNYEINRSKTSFDCPFKKDTEKSHCAELQTNLNISAKTGSGQIE